MIRLQAQVTTPNASRYLNRLCKHFSHKIDATWNGEQGDLQFESGHCQLTVASDQLRMICTATTADKAQQVAGIVGGHLTRFAEGSREPETLIPDWQMVTN